VQKNVEKQNKGFFKAANFSSVKINLAAFLMKCLALGPLKK
jgi:hypothetical protein